MRTEHAGVEPDAANPVAEETGILPGREAQLRLALRGEEKLSSFSACHAEVFVDRLAGLFGNFEPHRPAGLLLSDRRSLDGVSVRGDVLDFETTTSQPRSLLSMARLNSARSRLRSAIWRLVRIDHTCFGRSGGLAPVTLPLFQGMRLEAAS
jgi:hypothetical protein